MTTPPSSAAPAAWPRRRLLAGVVVAVLALDVVAKSWAERTLADHTIGVAGPLSLRLVRNPGVAFGLGAAIPAWLVLSLTGLITLGVAAAAWRGRIAAVPGGLVVGGALANLVDRATGGTVVDYLDLGWWPTFNLADVAITCGVALLILTQRPTRHHQTATAKRH